MNSKWSLMRVPQLIIGSLALLVSTLFGEPIQLPGPAGTGLPIVLSKERDEIQQAAAKSLSETLERIFSQAFPIVEAAEGAAIRLELIEGEAPGALEREVYTIQTNSSGIVLRGVTSLALRHSVWDLLYRIGYRQYFPGETWEIVPSLDSLLLDLNVKEAPDYASRRIWYGFGLKDHNREDYHDWVEKNRMDGGFSLRTGHAYGALIRSQRALFDAHPEYYALVGGERRINSESKLCISNPGLRAAAVAYALEFFEKNPEADTVSIDPSDGGNWCECDACIALGPPNDRATYLANVVAEAVTAALGDKRYVGMYAYNYHSEPPAIRVHPNVIISAATSFIKGGLTIDEIVSGWAVQGATLGIREYYSVNSWDRDLPAAARASRLAYLAKTIPQFHEMGARFLSAEASDNWGPNGLGYYFASRVMWDCEEAQLQEAIVEEFLEKCFGPAKEPMREFYSRIDGDNRVATLVFDDLLARMYRLLGEAKGLAQGQEAILARLDALLLWTRYCELYEQYRRATGAARQEAFETLVRHTWRMRGTYMVHSYALYRDLVSRDKHVQIPEGATWNVPEPQNPWKSSERFSAAELQEILERGIAEHTTVTIDFTPIVTDDTQLVAARSVMETPVLPSGSADRGRGPRSWFTVVEEAPTTLELQVTGGLIEHYRNRGNVKILLWKLGGASATGESETLIAEDATVPPDGVERAVRFELSERGIYRIDLDDGSDMTRVTWPEGQLMSWKMSLDDYPRSLTGRWSLYAWVPPGTKTIGLYSSASGGELRFPDGSKARELTAKGGGFLSIPVPEGMDGKFWKFHNVGGRVSLLTIPPYLARTPSELVFSTP